jgi:hypothetical protein
VLRAEGTVIPVIGYGNIDLRSTLKPIRTLPMTRV